MWLLDQLLPILETGKSRQDEVHKQLFVTATKYEPALMSRLEACKIMINELISGKTLLCESIKSFMEQNTDKG